MVSTRSVLTSLISIPLSVTLVTPALLFESGSEYGYAMDYSFSEKVDDVNSLPYNQDDLGYYGYQLADASESMASWVIAVQSGDAFNSDDEYYQAAESTLEYVSVFGTNKVSTALVSKISEIELP